MKEPEMTDALMQCDRDHNSCSISHKFFEWKWFSTSWKIDSVSSTGECPITTRCRLSSMRQLLWTMQPAHALQMKRSPQMIFFYFFFLLLLHKQRLNCSQSLFYKLVYVCVFAWALMLFSNGGHNHGMATLQMSFDFFVLCFAVVWCLDHFVASLNMFIIFLCAEADAIAVSRSFWRQN